MLATNLFRVLGKKTISEKNILKNKTLENEAKDNIFSDQVKEYAQKQIFELDKSFNFYSFIEGAKEAFKIIVEAFKKNKIEDVKHLVSEEVYNNFKKAAELQDNKNVSFNIISIKAAILNIEVVKNYAKIKVEFLSGQKEKSNNNTEDVRDIWTFKKDMTSSSLIWQLVEVAAD